VNKYLHTVASIGFLFTPNLRCITIINTTKYGAVKLGKQRGIIFIRSLMHCDNCDRKYAINDIHLTLKLK